MTGFSDRQIDDMADAQERGDSRPDDEPEQEPEPAPGDCPYCRWAIRQLPCSWRAGYYYNCPGCGCNWGNMGQIEYDRNIRLSAPLGVVADGRIDDHLAAVDAAELWYGEVLY